MQLIGIGGLLPKIILLKNQDLGVGLSESYKDYALIFGVGAFGVVFGVLAYLLPGGGRRHWGIIPRGGRHWGMIISAVGYTLSLFMFTKSTTRGRNNGISIVEYFCQSMFTSILYSWTAEAFPTSIRATAASSAAMWGRGVAAFMPIAAGLLLEDYGPDAPLILAGSGVALMAVLVWILPSRAFTPEHLHGT